MSEPTLLDKIRCLFQLAGNDLPGDDLMFVHRVWHETRGAVLAASVTTFPPTTLERVERLYAEHIG